MPVVEAPLALFQVQIESGRRHAIELLQPTFGIAPETLDAVDMRRASNELVLPMMDAIMFRVPDINESVITAPPVGVNDGLGSHATANNGL